MRGNRVATDGAPGATLLTGGLGYIGSHVAAAIREEHGVTSVVHLAGRKSAPESVLRPAWYFQQNIGALACVLEAMAQAGFGHLVFSSCGCVWPDDGGSAERGAPDRTRQSLRNDKSRLRTTSPGGRGSGAQGNLAALFQCARSEQ